jgi:REP element-mobilizing transposase RayT
MARQKRMKSESGYYHIMMRGNERKEIFIDDEDRIRFIETISEKKQKGRFNLHAVFGK